MDDKKNSKDKCKVVSLEQYKRDLGLPVGKGSPFSFQELKELLDAAKKLRDKERELADRKAHNDRVIKMYQLKP